MKIDPVISVRRVYGLSVSISSVSQTSLKLAGETYCTDGL